MASEKNLNAVFTDIANAIRGKKGTTDQIKPINMAEEITNLSTAANGTLKALLDRTKSCYFLFNQYKGTSVDGLISYSDTSNVTNMSHMFYYCSSLTTIPQLDTSKVNIMGDMFYNCSSLTTVPQLDMSSVIDMSNMFYKCSSLKSILMTGMKTHFDISVSTNFEKSDLVTILNNLATVTSTKTLTMGATNLAKLTDEEKAIATNKGWTLK